MNFLLSRSTHHVSPDLPSISELHNDEHPALKRTTTLEGLIADDPFQRSSSEEGDRDSDGIGDATGAPVDSNLESQVPMGNLSDVAEGEGCITIPCRVLPDDWSDASDIPQLRSLDRSFVFPGEQIHLLVCLSASKQHTEIITPFKVAAVISKNNYSGKNQTKTIGEKANSLIDQGNMNDTYEETADVVKEENGENISTADSPLDLEDISLTESLLRMEDHKHQTEALLESFRNSNFFVRIAHLDEPLWSKRNGADPSSSNSDMAGENFHSENIDSKKVSKANLVNAVIDRGGFDGSSSGGMARNDIRCYSLHNGDIVVLLQVNVAVSNIKDPVLEVIQFEKYEATSAVSENLNGLHSNSEDPCRELLNWLLPLDRTLPPRPLSPPSNSSSVLGVTQRSTSASSSSQIFSFGHFRSNSMPSLPQVNVPPSSTIPASYSKPSFEVDDYDRISQEKVIHQDRKNSELLSFRGVPLEPERFSVHCGLEGIYLPRRRWRRKVEIIQPIEIHSFAAECSIEDLLCVQVKNVTPAHLPDVTIFLDSIAIIFEEASKGGPPLSLPIASIETGNGHSLPNLSLRRGEEHSFILKPAATVGKDLKGHGDRKPTQSHQKMSYSTSNAHMTPRVSDPRKVSPSVDQYAVLVSCRCNYTESKLFFKQPSATKKAEEKGKERQVDSSGKQVCGVCLSEEKKSVIQGLLNCCSHYFCFACIMEWSKVESRCPLCKRRFETITKLGRSDPEFGMSSSAVVRVQKRDQVYQPSEEELRGMLDPYENVVCMECQQGGDDNLMLLCDICDSSAHTYCVGLGREVPEGNWYCECCRSVNEAASQSQFQETTTGQEPINNSFFSATSLNVDSPRPVSLFGCPSSLRIDLNASPRDFPGDNHFVPSPISGSGASTLMGRRHIRQRIHVILSTDRQRRTPTRTNTSQPSSVATIAENWETSPMAGNLSLPSLLGFQQQQQNPRPFFHTHTNLAPCMLSEGSSLRHVDGAKEEVRKMVRHHLKDLAKNRTVDHSTFKEIARNSTHTILAACGIEHRRSMVTSVSEPPDNCVHDSDDGPEHLLKGCCSSCFNSFVKDVVRRLIDTKT